MEPGDAHPASVPGRHLCLRLPAQPTSVSVARHAVAALIADLDVGADCRDAVALAVSEAVSNAVIHGYEERHDGVVDLFAIRTADQLIVTVGDRGRGLDHPAAHPGMGMGMHLIRTTARQALIAKRDHGGTTVQCRFILTGDRERSGA